MLQDHQAAQDAVQEAAFKAWRKLRQLRDGSDMRPWFLGIVANECRSVRRSRWSSVIKLLPPMKADSLPADSVLSGIELRNALRALDEKKRLALVLHWYLDLPLDEIASITGSSVHAVEGQVQRKRRSRRSVDRSAGAQVRSKWSPRPVMQLVASVLVLMLAAAVVTFLGLRNHAPQTAPRERSQARRIK